MGQGDCEASNGKNHAYFYTSAQAVPAITLPECADLCANVAASACWVGKQAEYPFRGFVIGSGDGCYCLIDSTSVSVKELCPGTVTEFSLFVGGGKSPGLGPIVSANGDARYQCYKYLCRQVM